LNNGLLITEVFAALIGELPRPVGQSQMALCPFHPDSTPSMKLDIDKNAAICFACRRSWTPEQFEKMVRGETDESVAKRNTILDMVDTFERQILSKIRAAGRHPIAFRKVFVMLDMARSTDTITYDDLAKINAVVDLLLAK
jgi:hypothetical protein